MSSMGVERHTRSGNRERRDRRGRALFRDRCGPLRSLRRSIRTLEWSRLAAAMLALLVGFTLTLVCQGHDRGNYHTGPHLTFLGGPLHDHSSNEQSVSPNDNWDSAGLGQMDMPG